MSKIYIANQKTSDEILEDTKIILENTQNSKARCKIFDTAGTYTFHVPTGVELVYITACGGGGGGGSAMPIGYDEHRMPGNSGGITSFGNLLSVMGGNGGKTYDDPNYNTSNKGGICYIPIYGSSGKDSDGFDGASCRFSLIFGGGKGGDGGYYSNTNKKDEYNGHGAGSGAYVIDCPVIVKNKSCITITIGKGGKGHHISNSRDGKEYHDGKDGEDGLLIVRW